MSIHITKQVWANGPSNPKERIVLLAIADHADQQGYAFPGIELIAQKSCMSDRNAIRILAKLEQKGWLRTVRKSAGPSRKGNSYYLDLSKLCMEVVSDNFCLHSPLSSAKPRRARTLSPTAPVLESDDIGNNPQVTNALGQVTKQEFSGDRTVLPIRINHHQPSTQTSWEPSRRVVRPVRNVNRRSGPMTDSLLERLAIVGTEKTRYAVGESIRLLAKSENISEADAVETIVTRGTAALQRGETVNVFWFEDGRWKFPPKTASASIGIYCPNRMNDANTEAMQEGAPLALSPDEVGAGAVCWSSMQDTLRSDLGVQKFSTWIAPVRSVGTSNGILYLELPSEDFRGIEERYNFHGHFPAGVSQIRCVLAPALTA